MKTTVIATIDDSLNREGREPVLRYLSQLSLLLTTLFFWITLRALRIDADLMLEHFEGLDGIAQLKPRIISETY